MHAPRCAVLQRSVAGTGGLAATKLVARRWATKGAWDAKRVLRPWAICRRPFGARRVGGPPESRG